MVENVTSKKVIKNVVERMWSSNKYDVMARGYEYYKKMKPILQRNSVANVSLFYQFLLKCKSLPYSKKGVTTTYEHVWGYYKSEATDEEKTRYKQLVSRLQEIELIFYKFPNVVVDAVTFIRELNEKYPKPYITQSNFIYPKPEWNIVIVKGNHYSIFDGVVTKV
ncbi:DUF1722 domain-containing protein [Alkalihalobacillus sp. LMS39]|uniref:DUF1722 domain-containing protein n=1 Tax=Alkalihalobacillus sp. LMS39 TaxID=2924032 RepID=UPI001FB27A92|nr:DUF1722 domain-containing protein [Alkalihalobacillus sp. LMS39]UOE93936.1 YbgA family protein [Alkalihalobacillus sp. LMS39]